MNIPSGATWLPTDCCCNDLLIENPIILLPCAIRFLHYCGTGTAYPSGAPEFKSVFIVVRVTQSLVLCVMFCRSSFVLLPFFFWPLCCLFFFDIRFLITPLASSKCSCHHSLIYPTHTQKQKKNLQEDLPDVIHASRAKIKMWVHLNDDIFRLQHSFRRIQIIAKTEISIYMTKMINYFIGLEIMFIVNVSL